VPRAFNERSDHFCRGLDLLRQADALPCEEIHGLKIPGSLAGRRKSHEAQERHRLIANLRLANAGLIGPLLAATRVFRQPALDKRRAQRAMWCVWKAIAEERGAHGLVFGGGKDLLFVYRMRIGFWRGDQPRSDHGGLRA
jgi:hypothetical protein